MADANQLPRTPDDATRKHEAPRNLAAEAGVLGAVLYDNNAFTRVADFLRAEDFYAPAHRTVFEKMQSLIARGRVADPVTLLEAFERDGVLQEIGGARYLSDLIESAAIGPEVVDYARVIHDLAVRRELIDIGAEMAAKAEKGDPERDGVQQIEHAERRLYKLAERDSSGGGFQTFASALAQSIDMAEAAYRSDGHISGVPTGLRDLDQKLGGLHKSDLLILAGRPSMGKTALATNIAYNAAKRHRFETAPDGSRKTAEGAVVGFFSLEMSAQQLSMRILADVTGISSDRIRKGDIKKTDFDKLADAAAELSGLPIHIDETGGISISQIAARARRLQRAHGLDLLIIDYLQLATASGARRNDNRVQEVSEVTQGLKALAKELNIPVIALSQLSRQVEQREDKRPQLSDLRESGSIEQDADVVMFVYRESYYLERAEPSEGDQEKWPAWREKMDEAVGKAEVVIGKQRHGPIGIVKVAFDANTTRFGDLEKRDYDPHD